MEIIVKVLIDLTPNTINALAALSGVNAPMPTKSIMAEPTKPKAPAATQVSEDEAPDVPAKPKAPAVSAGPAAKAKPAAKVTKFEDLDEDAQLEELKTRVVNFSKKGKTPDMKAILSNFGAARVSEVQPEDFVAMADALEKYKNGYTIDELFPNLD